MGGEEGEARVLLRSRADKATAKQNTARLCEANASLRRSRASERFRPTGVQEGATGLPVGLHTDGPPESRRAVAVVSGKGSTSER